MMLMVCIFFNHYILCYLTRVCILKIEKRAHIGVPFGVHMGPFFRPPDGALPARTLQGSSHSPNIGPYGVPHPPHRAYILGQPRAWYWALEGPFVSKNYEQKGARLGPCF